MQSSGGYDERPLAVLWEREQAHRFLADSLDVRGVVSLSPSVQVELASCKAPVIRSYDVLTNMRHLRGLARLRMAERAMKNVSDRFPEIFPATREAAIINITRIVATSSALWEILGVEGPWIIPGSNGHELIREKPAAHAKLLSLILTVSFSLNSDRCTRIGRFLLWLINNAALCRIIGQRAIILSGFTRGFDLLSKTLHEMEPNIHLVRINVRPATFRNAIDAIQMFYRNRSKRTTLVFGGGHSPDCREFVKAVLNSIKDPATKNGLKSVEPWLTKEIENIDSFSRVVGKWMAKAKPESIMLWDVSSGKYSTLAHLGQGLNIPVVLAAHAPVAPINSDVTESYQRFWATKMTASPLANYIFVQSPTAEQLVKEIVPKAPTYRAQPFVWGFRRPNSASVPSSTPMILHAGNYFEWSQHKPWLQETSDEMVGNLVPLVEAISGMPETQLVIRAKHNWRGKGELDANTLHALLPVAENCTIKDTGSFLDDLSACCLVISFASSTIEEALYARRPVLLWGGSQRYMYLPARTSPPAPDDRAAVYMPPQDCNLREFIRAVIDAHKHQPLSDKEVESYIWLSEQTPDPKYPAKFLIDRLYSRENAQIT